MFSQSLAQYFMLLWIDWGKQAPSAEQLPRYVRQRKRCSPISKSAPYAWAPKCCRKNNFPPVRGSERAPASATTGWTTARRGALREGNTSRHIGLGLRKSLPLVPRLTSYVMGPSFLPLILCLICLWEKFLKAESAFNMRLCDSGSKGAQFQMEPPCAATRTIMNEHNLKWCGKRPVFLVENYSSDLSFLKPLCVW